MESCQCKRALHQGSRPHVKAGGNIGTSSYSPGFPLDSCPARIPWEAQAPKETPVTTAQCVCTQQVEEKGQFSAACLGLAAPSKNLVSPVWTRQQAPAGCTGVSPGGMAAPLVLTFFDARKAMPWATWLENWSRSARLRGRRSSLVSTSSSELFPEIQTAAFESLKTWSITQALLYPSFLRAKPDQMARLTKSCK